MKCGLLGRKLGHSYSPQIHAQLGNYSYELFEVEPEELGNFFSRKDIDAFNVTIPYKKEVIPYLDILSPEAEKLGAVNTVVRMSDGRLLGHNTDCYGFKSLIQKSGISVLGQKVLVLGSGGASNTAVYVLREMGADVTVISRSGENNYGNIAKHMDAAVIVNTTPVGMYPNTRVSPVSLDVFPGLKGVVDLIYNPSKTKFLLDAQERGIPCFNGLWMLVAQAKEASEWFTGSKISDDVISTIHHSLEREMLNMILIGMPGSGKSTIGTKLANLLGRKIVDADAEIEKYAGKSIPEIFSQDGEAAFRKMETHVLEDLGKQSGLIIATGGGCVIRAENKAHLKQNGKIFWIQRDLHLLPTDGRPLSQANPLSILYDKRKDLYEQFSDMKICNNSDIDNTVNLIVKLWEAQS